MFHTLITGAVMARIRRAGALAVALLCPVLASAQIAGEGSVDHSESPYFAVSGGVPGIDSLPLKATRVDTRILGVIADVRVTQRYRNEGDQPLEANYVFPGSTRAAVYAMEVRLGGRVLTANIREKQKAQEEYQQAKSAGKTAALLEQHRENVFQMHVANILPGDDIEVELHYTELLVPTDGIYSFVFPTVVGPRYNGVAGSASNKAESWISTPYTEQGHPSDATFDMSITLASPTPLGEIDSPTHQLEVQRTAPNEVEIKLAGSGRNENDRDFILDYRLAGERIDSGLLLSKGEKENFFLAMLAPPKSVQSQMIVPREYIFVVDISGSMHGFPLDTAKRLLQRLVGRLRPSDSFNVLLFAGRNSTLAPQSMPATPENIRTALHLLDQQAGGGSTELIPALRSALALPPDQERSRSFIVVTDGFVAVEREAYRLVRENLANANLFAFGIGSSVNRQLVEGLARAGQGEPFIVLDEKSAEQQAERFRTMIEAPVLANPEVRFEGLDTYDVEPIALPDLFAQRPLVVFGKWRGEAKGKVIVEGSTADGRYHAELPVQPQQARTENQALRYLWARHRVAALIDQETLEGDYAYSQAILDLGLQYSLLTPYTSFVAIDEQVRNLTGESTSVAQPSPLPQGVSNAAIGVAVPSTPEPSTWAMLLIATLGMLYLLWRRTRLAQV